MSENPHPTTPARFVHRLRSASRALAPRGWRSPQWLLLGLLAASLAAGGAALAAVALRGEAAAADPMTVYGPRRFEAGAGGRDAIYLEQFSVPAAPGMRYIVKVDNGAADGSKRVSSAEVSVNGSVVVARSSLSSSTAERSSQVELLPGNLLEVRVSGAAGSYVMLSVLSVPDPTFDVYGPRTVERVPGSPPTVVVERFTLPADAGAPYTLHLRNGTEAGANRASSATVHVNGVQVVGSSDLNQQVGSLQRPLSLQAGENEVEIRIPGPPAGQVTVRIRATDTAPPVLEITSPAEGAFVAATEVEVSGTVQDRTAVQVTVNGEAAAVSNGSFAATVPLAEGENTLTVVARDAAGNESQQTRTVIRDTQAPQLSLTSPPDGLATQASLITVAGTATDANGITLHVGGSVVAVDGSGAFVTEVVLVEGPNFIIVTATDPAGNIASETRQVTRSTAPTLVVSEPAEGTTTEAESIAVSGTVTSAVGVTLTVNGTSVVVSAGGAFSTTVFLAPGANPITVVATANGLSASVTRTVTRTSGDPPDPNLPPDPNQVAPPLDGGVTTTLAAATSFLYSGPNPIQTGVAQGAISPVRVAVLRGRVTTREGAPLSGVTIRVHRHGEFGQTLSRADGMFDLAVNGGGRLTIHYEKSGYLPAQRHLNVPWQEFLWAPEVTLLALDSQVTVVTLAGATEIQAARGSPQTDADGTRRATLLFKPGTTAEMVLPNGTRQPLSSISVRATEATVGENGPRAMPAPLPPTTAYTYAVDLSADEALAAGAKTVEFSRPVPVYVENFLGFPVGIAVPVGWYDYDRAAWVPEDNGRVIGIVGVSGGLAQIDISGNGLADSDAALAALGIDAAERQRLAELYTAGTTLWRAQTTHFSWIDLNWPRRSDGEDPNQPSPDGDNPDDCNNNRGGSIIECESQVLGQRFGVAGTGLTLNYRSDRVPGRSAARVLTIPLSGASVHPNLLRIDVVVEVAGQRLEQSLPPAPNQSYTFEWDGRDAFGRAVQGRQPVTVRVGHVYPFYYAVPASSARSFGLTCTGSGTWLDCIIPQSVNSRARQEEARWQVHRTTIGTWDARATGLGGWSLDVHHTYDPLGQMLYLGDGGRRSARSFDATISRLAGGGSSSANGIPATDAAIYPTGLAVDGDGSVYIADWNSHRVRKITPDGLIWTVAGTGTAGFAGDGGPATAARLSNPHGVRVGPDGSVYIADQGNHRIRRVSPDGIITTVAGTGTAGFLGDGGPATAARLSTPRSLAVAADGTLYISDQGNNRVRRVGPDGTISTAAGNGSGTHSGDGGLAVQAGISLPDGVALGPDGSLYIVAQGNHRVRRVTPDGIITTLAGTGVAGYAGDGGPAILARISRPEGIDVGPDGSVYVGDTNNNRIRRISSQGIITTVTGTGPAGNTGDGGPATAARLSHPHDVMLHEDGSLYIADTDNNRIRRVSTPVPGFTAADILVADAAGVQLFHFDAEGRHLRTLDAKTGTVVYSFDYTPDGLLAGITDAYGLATVIGRDGSGAPTSIVAPFGQQTLLGTDANGFLSSIAHVVGEAVQLTYDAQGLLHGLVDPRGNAKHYGYDGAGRLVGVEDPLGGLSVLERTGTEQDNTVTFSTALGRTTTYRMERLGTGAWRRSETGPDGFTTITDFGTDGSTSGSTPDGMLTTVQAGPDPRFGMQSSLSSTLNVRTPAGRQSTVVSSRRVTLANPNDPLSLIQQLDSMRVNNRLHLTTYTAATRQFTVRSPQNRLSISRLDERGRVVQEEAPGLTPVTHVFGAQGLLTSTTQGGRTTSYTYDAAGRLSASTDALSRTSTYLYDAADRVTRQTLPDGRAIEYTYDANGNLTSVSPPGRTPHLFTYTATDQHADYTPPSAGAGPWATLYTYDLDQQLTRVTRPDGQSVDYGYDAAGRPSAISFARGTISFGYSSATGRLTSVAAPGGVGLGFTYDGSLPLQTSWSGPVNGNVSLTYDNNFWVTQQRVNGAHLVNFGYDADGLITAAGALTIARSAQTGLPSGTTLGSVGTSHTFDSFAELSGETASFGATPLYASSYTRDALGRITSRTESLQGQSTTYAYAYDIGGRLTEVRQDGVPIARYEYDGNGNRVRFTSPAGVLTGSYDAQDRLLSYGDATYTYSAAGDLTRRSAAGGVTEYEYDALGNLVRVVLPDGTQLDYLTDGQNRRVGKRVNDVLVQGFLYQDQLNPVAELDGSGNVVSRFVYGVKPNVPDYLVRGGVTYRIISDHLGSVRLVVNVSNGQVVQRIDYDAFGQVTQNTNPGFQPFAYAGGLYDYQSGLVRFGGRDYDPHTGRWTAKDPIGFAGGDTNLYGYVLQDPINLMDPDGHFAIPGVLIGAGLDLLAQLAANGGRWECVSWGQVGLAGALGAVGGGWAAGAFRHSKSGLSWMQASNRWGNVSQRLHRVHGTTGANTQYHHWLIQRNSAVGKHVPDFIKNHPWNINPVDPAFHRELHRMNPVMRKILGAPEWAQAGGASAAAGGAAGAMAGRGCGCD